MSNLPKLKPFLDDMLSMSTGPDGRTLQIHFSRPVTKEDRQAFLDAHNAIVRSEPTEKGDRAEKLSLFLDALDEWGCEDNDQRADQILVFQDGGYDLSRLAVGDNEAPLAKVGEANG